MTNANGSRHAPLSENRVITPIGGVRPQRLVSVTGVIRQVTAMSIGGVPACRYVLGDGTGELDLLFLGRVSVAGFECGRRCRAAGMAAERDHRMVLWNPWYWLEPRDIEPNESKPSDGGHSDGQHSGGVAGANGRLDLSVTVPSRG